jgi:maltose alpha-D-glucosyltransferase/alpha-amylase
MRSFHYAAFAGLLKTTSVRPEDIAVLEPWAEAWHLYVNDLFLRSYLDTVGKASFLPSDEGESNTLLEALLLEKALYEIKRELACRPDWLPIAMRGIRNIAVPNDPKSSQGEDAKK